MSAYDYLAGLLATLETQAETLEAEARDAGLDPDADYLWHYRQMQAATVRRLLAVDPVHYLAGVTVAWLDSTGYHEPRVSAPAVRRAFGVAVCDMDSAVHEWLEAVVLKVVREWKPAHHR